MLILVFLSTERVHPPSQHELMQEGYCGQAPLSYFLLELSPQGFEYGKKK